MSKKANPTVIGAFVLGALIVTVAAIAILGSGALFKKTERYVLFFDGNLAGLDVGAPVQYQGVQVGTVSAIRLEYHANTMKALIPVYIEFDRERISYVGTRDKTKGLASQIERGLRAQLQSQSLLTGKQKIMLIEKPGSPVNLVGADPTVPEVPTVPTLTDSLAQALQEIPFGDMISNVSTALQEIAAIVGSYELKETIASASRSSANLETLLSRLDQTVPALVTNLTETTQALNATLVEARGVLDSRSPVRYEFMAAMEQVGAAAKATQDLADYLQRHPESLLAGKKQSRSE